MRDRRGRVLVADDEKTMLELFRETLAGDWDVRVARDGEEAADLLERESFDVAFLDLRMPGRDGAEVLRGIRRSGRRGTRAGSRAPRRSAVQLPSWSRVSFRFLHRSENGLDPANHHWSASTHIYRLAARILREAWPGICRFRRSFFSTLPASRHTG